MRETVGVYALINDRAIPVESIRSLVAGPGGRILIAGAASADADRRQVQNALSTLQKKDVVSFNVVTTDWRAMTGMARITDVLVSSKSKSTLHFFVAMKMTKDLRPSKKK